MVREKVPTLAMSLSRSLGQVLGCEVVIETSEHDIDVRMEVPHSGARAWDDNLYHKGQLFVHGYANPIKPTIQDDTERDVDDIDATEGNGTDDADGSEGTVGMIPSPRYKEYMNQHLISELVRPESRWKLMMYILAGVAILQFVIMVLVVYFGGG